EVGDHCQCPQGEGCSHSLPGDSTPSDQTRGEGELGGRSRTGLGAFAGHYASHLWRTLEQLITETEKIILTSSLSLYYKEGFEQKMAGLQKDNFESSLYRKIPDLATKVNEAKECWNPVTKYEMQSFGP
uniref:Uncharacterized protein n=1 Tax=Cyanistes caeruleus TaxID=156563 RepID=A0A8C0ZC55_CYACU